MQIEKHFITGQNIFPFGMFGDNRRLIHRVEWQDKFEEFNKNIGLCQGWTREQYEQWKQQTGGGE